MESCTLVSGKYLRKLKVHLVVYSVLSIEWRSSVFFIISFVWHTHMFNYCSHHWALVNNVLPLLLPSNVMLKFFCSIHVKMGNSFKKAIFDDNVSEGLVTWAQNARRRRGKNTTNADSGASSVDGRYGGAIQMTNAWTADKIIYVNKEKTCASQYPVATFNNRIVHAFVVMLHLNIIKLCFICASSLWCSSGVFQFLANGYFSNSVSFFLASIMLYYILKWFKVQRY